MYVFSKRRCIEKDILSSGETGYFGMSQGKTKEGL